MSPAFAFSQFYKHGLITFLLRPPNGANWPSRAFLTAGEGASLLHVKVKDAANCEVTDTFQKMMKALSSLSRLFFLSKKGVIMSILQPRMDPTRQALPPAPPRAGPQWRWLSGWHWGVRALASRRLQPGACRARAGRRRAARGGSGSRRSV